MREHSLIRNAFNDPISNRPDINNTPIFLAFCAFLGHYASFMEKGRMRNLEKALELGIFLRIRPGSSKHHVIYLEFLPLLGAFT